MCVGMQVRYIRGSNTSAGAGARTDRSAVTFTSCARTCRASGDGVDGEELGGGGEVGGNEAEQHLFVAFEGH